MERWNIVRTVDHTSSYTKGIDRFHLVFAFTKSGVVKLVGPYGKICDALRSFPACHAFTIQYAKRFQTKQKQVTWEIVGHNSFEYSLLHRKRGFTLLRRVRGTNLYQNEYHVLGFWRRLPTEYLKELDGEAHKRYPYRKVTLCPNCNKIIFIKDVELDPQAVATNCRNCRQPIYSVGETAIGGTQVSQSLRRGYSIEQYYDYQPDVIENEISQKSF